LLKFDDRPVDAGRKTKVVGVDDQALLVSSVYQATDAISLNVRGGSLPPE
jgi:hypothetical protein